MTDLKITTVNNFDNDGVFPLRSVYLDDGEKSVRTPAGALRVKKIQKGESVNPDSRGVNELFRQVTADDLDQSIRKSNDAPIGPDLKSQFRSTNDDELRVAFSYYVTDGGISEPHADQLARLHGEYSDIVTVPLMTKLARAIRRDPPEMPYDVLRSTVKKFLDAVDDHHPNKPVMGVVPLIDWKYVADLMDLYESYGVQTFAVDLDRCKITTRRQRHLVQSLLRYVAVRDQEEYTLLYAINPRPGTDGNSLGATPAWDVAAFGLGFDIVGGCHVGNRIPEDEVDDLENDEDEEEESDSKTFPLFDKEDWVYRDVELDDIPTVFPADSGYDARRVTDRAGTSRLQHAINSEARALAAHELRGMLESGDAHSDVTEKIGVTDSVESAFSETRTQFDNARDQSSLDSF